MNFSNISLAQNKILYILDMAAESVEIRKELPRKLYMVAGN